MGPDKGKRHSDRHRHWRSHYFRVSSCNNLTTVSHERHRTIPSDVPLILEQVRSKVTTSFGTFHHNEPGKDKKEVGNKKCIDNINITFYF